MKSAKDCKTSDKVLVIKDEERYCEIIHIEESEPCQTALTSCHGSILISNDNRDVESVMSVQDSMNVPAGHTVWSDLALEYPVGDGAG